MNRVLLWLHVGLVVSCISACKTSSVDSFSVDFEGGNNTVERTRLIYDPEALNSVGLPQIPLVTDLLLEGFAGVDLDCNSDGQCLDGTIPFPQGDAPFFNEGGDINAEYNPIFSAVGDLDGFSTSAAVDITFDGALDPNSIVTTGDDANVILVALRYDNDPVLGSSQEPPKLSDQPYGHRVQIQASTITYSDEVELENNILRISPLTPLNPATKYLVIITDDLKNSGNIGVGTSATFNFAATAVGNISDPELAGLRDAIQNWVSLALGFLNSVLEQNKSASNIVYTTTFTTVGTSDVLFGMASPASFYHDEQLQQLVSSDIRYRIEQGIIDDQTNDEISEVICSLSDMDCSDTNFVTEQIQLARHLPQPAPRVTKFSRFALLPEDKRITIFDGIIKLPYYLSSPTGMNEALTPEGQEELTATAARVLTSIWRADDTLVDDLKDTVSNLSQLAPPSENITRHFPIAKTGEHTTDENKGYIEAPISVFVDTRAVVLPEITCPNGFRPIIYQHGITGNRRDASNFVSNLIDQSDFLNPVCDAIIAIDLPLHGLDGEDQDLLGDLYFFQAGYVNAIPVGIFDQRHFGLYQDEGGLPAAMILSEKPISLFPVRLDIAEKASGGLFINLVNFQGSRDNLRQAVIDSLNLNASLPYLDFSGINNGPDIDMSRGVHYAGHSLGGIVGSKLISVLVGLNKNNPYLTDIDAVVLANPGGNLTKLLENSFAFYEQILGGFEILGTSAGFDLSEGSSLLELTFHFFQATLDSADPINFGQFLINDNRSGIIMYEIAGDDSGMNPPDQVVPPAAYKPLGLGTRVTLDDTLDNDDKNDTAISPLAGSTPLSKSMGLISINDSVSAMQDEKIKAIVRFSQGSHSSFVSPDVDTDRSVFDELMNQTLSFFNSNGAEISMNNQDVIVQ